MSRQWLQQISVRTTLEAEDAVLDLLGRVFSQLPSVYTNAETGTTIASVFCQSQGEWNARRRKELAEGLQKIRACGLDPGTGKISARRVPRQDWKESWKRHFKPLAIGSRLLIKPSWIKRTRTKNHVEVVQDPGLRFGTGNHPTTAFCLRELVVRSGAAQAFLDIGTGSGILAIAAAKLGYVPVEAFDFDPEAVRAATGNSRRNRVLDKIRLRHLDIARLPLRSGQKHHLICANLISNLLLAERDRIVNRLHPSGALVLAGILQREFAQVQKAYERAGLKLVRSRVEKEWQSGTFVFRL